MLVDLFYREGLEVPRSLKRVWDLLVIIAAALLIFDVAARRISIDPHAARAMAAGALKFDGLTGDVPAKSTTASRFSRSMVTLTVI